MAKDDVHVVIIPFCAFGHMIPNFLLSLALAKSGIHVHFIATPRNIQRLPKIPPHLSPLFHFISLPFPPLEPDFLPDGAEATMDVPFDKFDNLKVAYDLLQPQVKHFIVELMPDWIISDYAAHWVVDIAEEHGVPLAYFSLFNAACSVFFGPPENLLGTKRDGGLPTPESLTLAPDWVPFPSAVAFRPFEAKYVARGFFGVNGSGISDAARLAKVLSASQVVGIRTCEEVEGDYLQVYREITGKKVIPTGLLPPEKPTNDGGPSSAHDDEIFNWLGKQEPKSVVYVGFGSECKLSKDQVFAIAHGLELSGLPFLWALRKPEWADTKADALPPEFSERTSEKGLVCMEWVPQMQILGHPSVGGSLSHSGWSSVIELLQFGHVIATLPVSADQPMNARLTEEKGLAVEVKRQEDGSFSKEEIAKTLRQAMVEDEGEELRSNARKAALVFGDHKLHQDHYMGQFVHFLKSNVSKRSS